MEIQFVCKLIISVVFIVVVVTPLLGRIFRRDGRLPATTYRVKPNSDAPFCTVCLDRVTQGEKIRILPKCKHCYHVECIDAWLESHSTCPNCMDQVIPVSHQQQRINKRNFVFSLIILVEHLSTKFGYPLDFGISLGSCV